MTKVLIKWKVNSLKMPDNPEEILKLLQSTNEWIKSQLASGNIKDYGEYFDGTGGYAIAEGDVTLIYEGLMEFWPYVEFDAKPVLSIDQVIEWTNRLIAKKKGK